MKYLKHYAEWEVSHLVFSRLGKLLKCPKKVVKVWAGGGDAAATKIKKSTIQNVDSFEMKRGGGSRFSDFPLYSNDRNMALILMIYWLDISDM